MKTRIITADFSSGTSIYDGIRQKLQGLNIGILGRTFLLIDTLLKKKKKKQQPKTENSLIFEIQISKYK